MSLCVLWNVRRLNSCGLHPSKKHLNSWIWHYPLLRFDRFWISVKNSFAVCDCSVFMSRLLYNLCFVGAFVVWQRALIIYKLTDRNLNVTLSTYHHIHQGECGRRTSKIKCLRTYIGMNFWCGELTPEVCASVVDTSYICQAWKCIFRLFTHTLVAEYWCMIMGKGYGTKP